MTRHLSDTDTPADIEGFHERALRRSEERYRLLVEQMVDGIFVADAQGRYIDVNQAGCDMLGYSRDELLALSIADVVASSEAERVAPEMARLAGGRRVRSEWRFRRKDGSHFFGEVVGLRLPDGRLQGVLRDVTERRLIEEQLQATDRELHLALLAADLGTWRHDLATGLVRLDARAQAILGGDGELVPLAELFAHIHPDDAARVVADRETNLDPARSPGEVGHEFRVVDPDGGVRWVLVHSHVEFVGSGARRRAAMTLGTVEDISERKRIEDQVARLSRAYETLSEINKCVARAGSEADLLAGACRIVVERAGFRLVRVAVLDEALSAPAAPKQGDALEPQLDLFARSRLVGLLEAKGCYCSFSPARDAMLAPWGPAWADGGVNAVGIFPLRVGGQVAYGMALGAGDADGFDAQTLRLLSEMAADISFGLDRLAQARRVRDSELRFSTMFRYSPDSILIMRMADGLAEDANDAFLESFGYSLDEVVGQPVWDAALWARAEERDALFARLERTGTVKEFEACWQKRSGERVDCLISGEIVVLGGQRHLVCTAQDVTERRRAERMLYARKQEFRALAENSPDIISRFGRDGRRLYANPEMGRAFGVAVSDLIGKTTVEGLPDSQMARKVHDAVARVIASAAEIELEVEGKEAGGTRSVHRHLRLVPEFGTDGQVASVLAIGRDISRMKETERRLRESQEQLRRIGARREAAREDERKRMAREIHDVLGQLLTALRLDVDMLGMEFGAEQPMLTVRTARTMAVIDETIAIVRNLASALRPAALDMGIVSAIEWQAKEFSGRTGIRCDVVMEEGDLALDEAQATAVFRLVQESLTNVLRHARASRVMVALERTGEEYHLAVSDDGVGFDPAAVGISSLGLVGMRERSVGLGGALVIDSAKGRGTSVNVRFPATKIGD
jgi:PAS domain S-box-containing protein